MKNLHVILVLLLSCCTINTSEYDKEYDKEYDNYNRDKHDNYVEIPLPSRPSIYCGPTIDIQRAVRIDGYQYYDFNYSGEMWCSSLTDSVNIRVTCIVDETTADYSSKTLNSDPVKIGICKRFTIANF